MTRPRPTPARRGAALLEAIVALALLSIAGLALMGIAVEATRAIESIAESERRLRDAGRLLDAVSLWSRVELDQRLGERPQGEMRLRISRVDAELYSVQLFAAGETEPLLVTTLLREVHLDAAR